MLFDEVFLSERLLEKISAEYITHVSNNIRTVYIVAMHLETHTKTYSYYNICIYLYQQARKRGNRLESKQEVVH